MTKPNDNFFERVYAVARQIPYGKVTSYGAIAKAIPRVVKGMKAANVKDPAQPCGLGWSFEQAALRNPDGPASLQGDVVLSYAQVNQWANRIAHHLIAQGIRKGDGVAVFIENRPELLVTILAVAQVGAISALLLSAATPSSPKLEAALVPTVSAGPPS